MEKGEGREKWSSSSSGPPSEGSEYSVANHHYYQKYELIYQHGCSLEAWHSHLAATETRLHALITQLAAKIEAFNDTVRPENTHKKKPRRTADDIHKCYRCEADNCQKLYASETSLRCHIKHAHPDIFTARKRGRRTTPANSQQTY